MTARTDTKSEERNVERQRRRDREAVEVRDALDFDLPLTPRGRVRITAVPHASRCSGCAMCGPMEWEP